MPSIIPDYEYDIFISYRQKDNKQDGWVTEFINSLKNEIEATFKEDISIYYDENPFDGLGESHDVDDSLAKKLKCLIFIPIISQTYCDPNSFAWTNEFLAFNKIAEADVYGLKVTLPNGNTASRVLPIRIHDISDEDKNLVENEIGFLRSIDFVYQSAGVNRPLSPSDNPDKNINETLYKDQINKVANSIKDIIAGIKTAEATEESDSEEVETTQPKKIQLTSEIKRRNVLRTSLVYILSSLVLWKGAGVVGLPQNMLQIIPFILIILFPISVLMAWLYERSPQGFIRAGSAASRDNPFTDAQKKPLTSNTFILLLVATVVALFLIYPQSSSQQVIDGEEIDKSIAVIPFTDMSQGGDQQYFADGVMEDILSQLQRMGELRVTSRTSVEQYRNTTKDATEIGAELKVSYLLEGSIRKSEDQIMITAQLIRTGDDRHLWANSFTSEYTTKGLFDIQRQIAENIVRELKLKISPSEVAEITQAQTENKEAYEHFIRGRELYLKANKSAVELAVKELQLAIAKDAQYAAAYGQIANAFWQRVVVYRFSQNWFDSARVYANQGITYDKNCAECYKALGMVLISKPSPRSAIEQFEKAVSINPNYLTAIHNLVVQSSIIGDYQRAAENVARQLRVNPYGALNLGILYREIGSHDRANKYFEKNISTNKGNWGYWHFLGTLYMQKKNIVSMKK